MSRITREEMYWGIVDLMAQRSVCTRKQVGAIIVQDGRIVVTAYNGPPSGVDLCCRAGDDQCDGSIHAEMNAIAWAARKGVSIEGATMYLSMSPCLACAKVLINSGIKEVIFRDSYRKDEGIQYLKDFVRVSKWSPEQF